MISTLVLLVSTFLFGFQAGIQEPVIVKADLTPVTNEKPKITIGIDGKDVASCYANTTPDLGLCTAYVSEGTHDLFVKIKIKGYKEFSKNVPIFKVGSRRTILDIGQVLLTKSDEPAIEAVRVGIATDQMQGYWIQVDLVNPSAKNIFIKKIRLSARGVNESACAGPGPEYNFSLAATFLMRTVSADRRELIGALLEKSNGKEYQIPAIGYMTARTCGSDSIAVDIPASVLLPASQFVKVNLFLPKQFRITRSSSRDGAMDPESRGRGIDVFENFRDHKIWFMTSDDEEEETGIAASFSYR